MLLLAKLVSVAVLVALLEHLPVSDRKPCKKSHILRLEVTGIRRTVRGRRGTVRRRRGTVRRRRATRRRVREWVRGGKPVRATRLLERRCRGTALRRCGTVPWLVVLGGLSLLHGVHSPRCVPRFSDNSFICKSKINK